MDRVEYETHRRLMLAAGGFGEVVSAVLELHAPDTYGDCDGCDWGGYDGPGLWPCRTVLKLNEWLHEDLA